MKSAFNLVLALLLLVSASSIAQVNVIYVNGILADEGSRSKKPRGVRADAERIAGILVASNHTGIEKRDFTVTYKYNPRGWYDETDRLLNCNLTCQDAYELLVLKASEEVYDSNFSQLLLRHSSTSQINLDQAVAAEVKKHADNLLLVPTNATIMTEERTVATKRVIRSIAEAMFSDSANIVVGHSQANLLINLAWATAIADRDRGVSVAKRVRVVNVANTSRFAVSGLNLTHDSDNVLFDLLRNLPNTYKFLRRTPESGCDTNFCRFTLAPPTFQASDEFTCTFFTCKHWMETYLSEQTTPTELVDQFVSYFPSKTRFRDRFEDLVYAAATSLELSNPSAQSFTDTFNRTDDTLIGNGWTEESYRNNASNVNLIDAASILENRLRISHTQTGFNVDAGLYQPFSQTCGVTVSGTVEWIGNLATSTVVGLNGLQTGNQLGLQLILAPSSTGSHSVNIFHEGAPIGGPAPFTYSVATPYNFEWTIRSDCSSDARVWRSVDSKPSAPTASSPAVSLVQRPNPLLVLFGSGGAGCCTYPGYDLRFDDFAVRQRWLGKSAHRDKWKLCFQQTGGMPEKEAG